MNPIQIDLKVEVSLSDATIEALKSLAEALPAKVTRSSKPKKGAAEPAGEQNAPAPEEKTTAPGPTVQEALAEEAAKTDAEAAEAMADEKDPKPEEKADEAEQLERAEEAAAIGPAATTDPEPEKDETSPDYGDDALRTACREAVEHGAKKPDIIKLMKDKYGVDKVFLVPADKRADFIKDLGKLGA